MVFTRSKLKELSKVELIESFDNLSGRKKMIWQRKWTISLQNLIMFFLSCRLLKPAVHYYANELLIWSDHPSIFEKRND